MTAKKILVSTTTYNEVDSVTQFLKETNASVPDADILIVDDSSPDGTGQLLESLKSIYPKLTHISRPGKLGIGSAHLMIMQYALKHQYDYLITLDADLSHDPANIPSLIKLLEQNDFAIGSRYTKGGSCDYGAFRQGLSRTANHLTRLLLGVKSKESTTSFRSFHTDLLRKLPLKRFKASDYGFFIETVYWINKVGARSAEFPIHFKDRRFGQTKISKKAIVKAFLVLVRLFFKDRFGKQKELDKENFPTEQCRICQSEFHIELYPKRSGSTAVSASAVACSTGQHLSHGRIARCLKCGSVSNNPMPSTELLMQAYSDVVDETYIKNIEAREATFRYNFLRIKNLLPKSGKLLDIGCYCGAFLKIAKEQSYQPVGIEPSKWASQQASTYADCKVYQGTLEDLPKSEKSFEIITAFDVLEHLVDPGKELRKINSRLPQGGFFVFSTLDFENWFASLLGEKWPWMMDMHLHYFSVPSLNHILKDAGFRLIDTRPYCHIIPSQYFFYKLMHLTGWKIFSTIAERLPQRMAKLQLPFRFGDIKLFTCIKINDLD